MIEIFGSLPLWIILLIGIIIIFIAWKLIKFAIKIFLILIIAFLILLGLDFLNVFDFIQNILNNFLYLSILLNEIKNISLSTNSNLPKS